MVIENDHEVIIYCEEIDIASHVHIVISVEENEQVHSVHGFPHENILASY